MKKLLIKTLIKNINKNCEQKILISKLLISIKIINSHAARC